MDEHQRRMIEKDKSNYLIRQAFREFTDREIYDREHLERNDQGEFVERDIESVKEELRNMLEERIIRSNVEQIQKYLNDTYKQFGVLDEDLQESLDILKKDEKEFSGRAARLISALLVQVAGEPAGGGAAYFLSDKETVKRANEYLGLKGIPYNTSSQGEAASKADFGQHNSPSHEVTRREPAAKTDFGKSVPVPTRKPGIRKRDESVPQPRPKPAGRNASSADIPSGVNPFSVEEPNLRQQAELVELEPILAMRLIRAANRDPKVFGL